MLRGGKMLWLGASWVKRLQFWLNWGVGWVRKRGKRGCSGVFGTRIL